MLRNALIFRLELDAPLDLPALQAALQSQRFVPCTPGQAESLGWVPPRGAAHDALAESVAGQWILRLCTERKPIPAAVVKEELQAVLDRIEHDTGRRPRGKAARELKEQVVHALLPRAFSRLSHTLVWLDLKAGWLVVDATSLQRADAVLGRLADLSDLRLRVLPLQTRVSPAVAMSTWLEAREAPPGFSIDRDCELRQPDRDRAVVRYTRHALDIDELAGHVREGKQPTRLALTWDSRVSFVLTDTGGLRRIELLDTLRSEGTAGDATAPQAPDFDADMALVTGELQRLIPDLVDALGGTEPQPTL